LQVSDVPKFTASRDQKDCRPVPAPKTRAELFAFLEQLGIETKTLDHPPLFTVAESSEVEQALPGGHSKNLFLKDANGELILIVSLNTTRVDLKGLPKVINSGRLSFGKPELLMEALGVTPGSVCVFSLINDPTKRVRLILDRDLMAHESINAHPLENTATTNIARADLLRFIDATNHDAAVFPLAGS
jgi:Ala-tRNA(Pro) deacylase